MKKGRSKKLKGKSNAAGMFLLCLFTFSFFVLPVSAQDDDDLAPPPLKILTKDDRARLEGEPDLKNRTKLVVEMMKARIDAAEKLMPANNFDGVFREFGYFRALLDYALGFLQKQDMKENRSLDNYKRLELSLRAATPRIESIRRELPVQYEEYVRGLLVRVRDARSQAIDPLFSDTVIPGDKLKK